MNTDHKATLSNMHADMVRGRGRPAYPSVRGHEVNAAIDEEYGRKFSGIAGRMACVRLWGPRGRQWRKAGNPGRKAAAETGLCEARSGLFPLGGNGQG